VPIIEDKGDWIRIPFSGRIECRVKENRFTLKDAVAEIVGRRWTLDNSQIVKRDMTGKRRTTTDMSSIVGPQSPASPGSDSLQRNQSSSTTAIGMPGGVTELPAALSALVTHDSKTLPPYPHSEVDGSTVISGSSSDIRV
jgi:hypothetical protein